MDQDSPSSQRPSSNSDETDLAPWRRRLHEIIFEADTPAGRAFDVGLFVAIGISILVVMLETVEAISRDWGPCLQGMEWLVTLLFTGEYVLRIACVRRPWSYIISFYGIVDLLSLLPTYLGLAVAPFGNPAQSSRPLTLLVVIRGLRFLRVFRVLKLAQYMHEVRSMSNAFRQARAKITVLLAFVTTVVLILGATMYLIEGPERGFTSIPRGVYRAIVTVTTVGYGDIRPQTPLGQALAALAMLTGYTIIIVSPGMAIAEMSQQVQSRISTQVCPSCSREGHEYEASHCKYCGSSL